MLKMKNDLAKATVESVARTRISVLLVLFYFSYNQRAKLTSFIKKLD